MKADIEIYMSRRYGHAAWQDVLEGSDDENVLCLRDQLIAIILGYADPVELR